MLLAEAIELMEAGESVVRDGWTADEGYLQLMKGMNHIWKIMLHPNPNAGNYIFSKNDLTANDWKKFEIEKPVIESVSEEQVAA